MDPRIESPKSTTYFGCRLTRRRTADIQETVAMCLAPVRNELAKTVCEHLNWTTPAGGYRVKAGLGLLDSLEACGILKLQTVSWRDSLDLLGKGLTFGQCGHI